MRVMTIDPGDHIGIIWTEDHKNVLGRTIEGDDRLKQLWRLLLSIQPEEIIFEKFALRASAAQKLVGNTFITCEVIGVVKLYCQLNNVAIICLTPSCKEYCGFSSNPKDPHYKKITMVSGEKITEHVRDAYRLYSYYRLFGGVIARD